MNFMNAHRTTCNMHWRFYAFNMPTMGYVFVSVELMSGGEALSIFKKAIVC